MRRWLLRVGRLLPHSYVLLALGALFVGGIVWNLWLRWQDARADWMIFVAGMLAMVYVAVAVTIVTTIPRDEL